MKKILHILFVLATATTLQAQSLITDLRPGLDGSEPILDNAFQVGSDLFFIANSDGLGSKLYKTNGSNGNTVLLQGSANLIITNILGVLNNEVYYIAGDIIGGETLKLYKTNGMPNAGTLVSDYHQGNDILINYPMTIVMNNVLYFFGNDGVAGFELWRTDGTSAGTYLVKDINPGIESCLLLSSPKNYFTQLNGFIYFGAAEPVTGAELWKSDGTEAGTTLVANIDDSEPLFANMGSNPAFFCTYNNAVYFSGYRPVDGRELWKTDGTAAGTVLVRDITSGSSDPSGMKVYNGLLYFSAFHPDQNFALYKSDGTTAGTTVVEAPNAGGPILTSDATFHLFKGKLFFEAMNDLGFHNIWFSDGTASGTSSLPNAPAVFTDYPTNLLATSNYLYFQSSDSNNPGVYRTTELPNEVTRLTDVSFTANVFLPMFLSNNCLIVRGDNGSTGDELYTVCNQVTNPVGIGELIENKLLVYPNPCSEKAVVRFEKEIDAIQVVYLQDLNGKTTTLDFNQMDATSFEINELDKFSSGLYFIQIQTATKQTYTLKITIQ
jgi:ELWxxDGT repeat protein